MNDKPTPTDALALACQVKTVERSGFNAVVFSLHGDGYFSECLKELRKLVVSHKPKPGPDGSVSHFLLFDLREVRFVTDPLIGIFLAGARDKASGLLPAVGIVRFSKSHESAIDQLRLGGLFPCFADETAAFDAMSPSGFPCAVSWIEEMDARRQAEIEEAAERRVPPALPAEPAVTETLTESVPCKETDIAAPVLADVPEPKQSVHKPRRSARQRLVLAGQILLSLSVATVLSPIVALGLILLFSKDYFDGYRARRPVAFYLWLPVWIAGAIVLYPLFVILAIFVTTLLFGMFLERASLRCRQCGGRKFESVPIDPPVEDGDSLLVAKMVCANCGKFSIFEAVSR